MPGEPLLKKRTLEESHAALENGGAPQKKPVARGERNTFNTPPSPYYAFVTDVEGADGDPQYVEFECVEARWMDDVWSELQKLTPEGFNAYFELINGRRFEDFYPELTLANHQLFYAIYFWFLRRVLEEGDEAPVAIFSLELAPGDALRDQLLETDWYRLELARVPSVDEEFAGASKQRKGEQPGAARSSQPTPLEGALSRLGLTPDRDRPPVERRVVKLELMPDASSDRTLTLGALKALHFPLAPPPIPEPQPSAIEEEPPLSGGPGSPDSGMTEVPVPTWIEVEVAGRVGSAVVAFLESAATWLGGRLREGLARLADLLERWLLPPPPPAFAFAGAGAGRGRASPRPAPPCSCRRPLPGNITAYVGSGAANPMDAAQGGAIQPPFVGFLEVGQGNCNVLYDVHGRAIVFYDFGSPATGQDGSLPVLGGHKAFPCLCNGPLIVLSHWDMDHCNLGRFYPAGYRCRWLAPQQHMGTIVCRDAVARVVHDGGEFWLWTASGRPATPAAPPPAAAPAVPRGTPSSWNRPGGSHLRFPWGFVERCHRPGQNPLAAGPDPRNNSGLAMYVCVRDAPGPPAVVAAGPAALDANNLGGAGAALVAIAGGAPPAWLGAAFAGPVLPNIPDGLPAFLAGLGAPAAAARAESLAAGAALAALGVAPAAAQRVAAAVAVVNPPLAAAAVANLARRVCAAADAAAAMMGATRAQIATAAGAAVHLWNAAAGTPMPTYTALGQAAAGGPALPAASPEAAALGAAFAALGLAADPVTAMVLFVGGVGVPGGGAAVRAAVRAAMLQAGLVGPQPGLSAEADVAVAAGAQPATVCRVLQAALPATLQGEAPFHANERYVLLTGDTNFCYIAAQKHPFAPPGGGAPGGAVALHALPAHPPVVVGLTATHHGSDRIGAHHLDADYIPWAPNSSAARGAAAANAGAVAGLTPRRIAELTATAVAAPAAALPALQALVRAADAAAAAACGAGFNLANAATAAATAILTENGAAGVGIAQAGAIGAAVAGGPALPGGSPQAVAQAAVAAAIGAAPNAFAGSQNAVAAVAGGAELVRATVFALATALAPPPALATTSARRAVEAVHAGARPAAAQPLVAAVAAAVAVNRAVAAGAALTAASAAAVAQATRVGIAAGAAGAAAAIGAAAIAGLPAGTAAQVAAALAAIPGAPLPAVTAAVAGGVAVPPIDPLGSPTLVANALGVSPVVVWEAMLAAGQPVAAAALRLVEVGAGYGALAGATSVVLLGNVVEGALGAQIAPAGSRTAGAVAATGLAHQESRRIGYSYGVTIQGGGAALAPPYGHHYANAAGVGHPYHEAVDKYRDHGWTERRNTSVYAAQSVQPHAGPNGSFALGWEVVGGLAAYEGPLRAPAAPPAAAVLSRVCASCAGAAAAGAGGVGVAAATGIVPAAAAAVAPTAAATNAARAGSLSVAPALAARAGVPAARAARQGVPAARAAAAGVPAARAVVAALDAARLVLVLRPRASTAVANLGLGMNAGNAALGAFPFGMALPPNTGGNAAVAAAAPGSSPAAGAAVGAAWAQAMITVGAGFGAGGAWPATRASLCLAVAAAAIGGPPLQVAAAASALYPGTAAVALAAANRTAAALAAGGAAAAPAAAALAAAIDAQILGGYNPGGALAAEVGAATAMAAGIAPLVADAAANALGVGAVAVAGGYNNASGAVGATPLAAAAVVAAARAMTVAGVVPGAGAEAGACCAAAAAAAGAAGAVSGAQADAAAGGLYAGALAAGANAVLAANAMNSSAPAGAAVAAAQAVVTAAGAVPAAPAEAGAAYAAAAGVVGVAAADADAAAGAVSAGALASAANAALAAAAMNSSLEAGAAVAAAQAVVAAAGLAPPAPADAGACYAAAAGAVGVAAGAADAAAGALAAGALASAANAGVAAAAAGASREAAAAVAAAIAVTANAGVAGAAVQATGAAAAAAAIGIPQGEASVAANTIAATGGTAETAAALAPVLLASGSTPQGAAAVASVRALEPLSSSPAAAAAAAGVPGVAAARAGSVRCFNV